MNHTALQSAVSLESLAMLSSVISKHGDDNTLKALAGILAEMGKPETAQSVLVARTVSLMETPIAAAPSAPVKRRQFTQKELEEAFDRVKNPRDWKAPIAANVFGYNLFATCEAIEHFTATYPRAVHAGYNKTGQSIYHVTSPGYRAGPAGDH